MTVIDCYNFTHELDRKALNSLQGLPGFTKLLKAYMRGITDRQTHLMNMSSKVLLGPNQLPRIYNLLPPICERLGIEQPPLYLELDRSPNAYTRGDNIPDITLTTGLLEHMTDDEIQIIMAHECGHIVCHHVLYHTMGEIILSGATAMINLPVVGTAMELGFMHWMRCSEFSADRAAAVFCGDATQVAQVMFRLAGCPKDVNLETDLDLFMSQAGSYEEFMNDSSWNKFLSFGTYAYATHPLTSVRASEISKWGEQDEFKMIIENLDSGAWNVHAQPFPPGMVPGVGGVPGAGVPGAASMPTNCLQCGAPLLPGAAFCTGCGAAVAPAPQPVSDTCTQCGNKLDPQAAFCAVCGQARAVAQPAPMPMMQPQPTYSSTDKIKNNLQGAINGVVNKLP